MTRYTRPIAGARLARPLLAALLAAGAAVLASAAAFAADDFPVPLVMKSVPPDRGSWQIEMLEGPRLEEMRKQTGGKMTLCQSATQALARRSGAAASESACSSRLVENTPTRAVVETTCKGSPPRTSRSTITADGARSYVMSHEQATDSGRPQLMKMRMSYLGPCSEGDAAVSIGKDTPACQQARAHAAAMDPATACASAGAQRAQCEAMMNGMRERLAASCK